MMRLLRGLLFLAGFSGLLSPSAGFSQSTPPADPPADTLAEPTRVEDTPEAQPPLSPLPPANRVPSGAFVPPNWFIPGPNPALEPGGVYRENGVLGAPGQWSGWYANIEAGLIKPHVNSHLNNGGSQPSQFVTSTTLGGSLNTNTSPNIVRLFGDRITLPVAPLSWTGSPRLRLGYRLPDGAGDFQLEWRMAASQGNSTVPNLDAYGAGLLRSRVNVQYASFTYGTDEFLTNTTRVNRTWGGRLGLAAGDVFFDSRAQGRQILEQSASNSFGGVGPTLQFFVHKPIAHSPFSLYSQLNGTGLIGFTRQHFSETIAADGQTLTESVAPRRASNAVGIFGVEGGLSYVPWQDRTWRFTLGYQWQRWWWVGATSDSNADLTLQGIIFRGEWRY